MDMDKGATAIIAVISSVIGLAIVAVLVSKNAQTPSVIGAAGSALARIIGAAVAPVTGGGAPGSGFGGTQGIGGGGANSFL